MLNIFKLILYNLNRKQKLLSNLPREQKLYVIPIIIFVIIFSGFSLYKGIVEFKNLFFLHNEKLFVYSKEIIIKKESLIQDYH